MIAHLSDLHFGRHDPPAAATLADDVAAAGPDVVVVTGDSTTRARNAEFAQARAFLDGLVAPLLVVCGNHDVPLFGVGRLVAPYDRYRAWLDVDLEPRLDLPGIRALGLQSMPRWRWKNGRVSARQSALVGTYLGAAPTGAVRLLALHHPPFVRGPARIAGRGALLRAVAAAGVDLVLAGHTHVPASRRLDLAPGHRLVEVVAGTATSLRLRGAPRSWTVIRVDAGHIHVEARVEVDGCWRGGPAVSHPRAAPGTH
ncbi:metallophosphoesterase family protein [Dactylosporangium sp. McL0621]|uniref:metallophosphoesterase family protein n=1 Tax=Dactylosporangium sp. McL0621 TaxID=3415678 RepID=UPI003CEDD627